MGFLSKLFGVNNTPSNNVTINTFNNENQNNSKISSLNLNKEQSLQQLNLRKQAISSLCLEKNELNGLVARVCMVMDISGSMDTLYKKGKVQEVVERLLPVAMQFDDNGVMEAWVFSNNAYRIPDISLDNYYGYINENRLTKKYDMGGTEYAPVVKDVIRKYVKEEPANIPTLVLFITDGDNSDKIETTRAMIEASRYPIFWQFVGIGNSRFSYLEELDEMQGRFIDNANFFSVNDLDIISDDELYKRLLSEYPDWITKAKQVGLF